MKVNGRNVENGFDCMDEVMDSFTRTESLEKVLSNPTFKSDVDYGDDDEILKSNEWARFKKMANTKNFKRYAKFASGENLDKGTSGYKLWWSRNGFPTINTTSILGGMLGEYNIQIQFDACLLLFTRIDEKEVGEVRKLREEMVAWYAKYIGRINTLYDRLTKQRQHLDWFEWLDEFNLLCEDGWRLFMYYYSENLPAGVEKMMIRRAIPFGFRNAYIANAKKWSAKLR